jgi:regulator of protease activity HflC (stomatin/prohibitin superfamily)
MAFLDWSRYLRRKVRVARSSFSFGSRQIGDIVDWGNDKSYKFDGKRWKKVEDVDEMELSVTDVATEVSDTTLPSAKALSDLKVLADAQVEAAKAEAEADTIAAKEEAEALVLAAKAEAAAATLAVQLQAEADKIASDALIEAAKAEAEAAAALAVKATSDVAATNATLATVASSQSGVDNTIKSLGTKVNFNLGLTQYQKK